MKKMSRKDLKRYNNVYYVAYCDLQYLLGDLSGEVKVGYNMGIYGWNWSAYAIDGESVIVTGYRNLCGKRIPGQLVEKYNNLAKKARDEGNFSEIQKDLISQLLDEAIAK